MVEEADDVVVGADLLVQADFYVELFGTEAAGAEGVVFVDEFYCDDRAGTVSGDCFSDAVGVLVSCKVWWRRLLGRTMRMLPIR